MNNIRRGFNAANAIIRRGFARINTDGRKIIRRGLTRINADEKYKTRIDAGCADNNRNENDRI